MNLEQRFRSLHTIWVTDETRVDNLWIELTNKYNETHRHYHNLEHIRALFAYYDDYNTELKYPNEVACALFYHDIIYDIWSKKNELKSAELVRAHLESYRLNDSCIDRICNLIMVTKDHKPKDNEDEKWMIDFDIGILGRSWDRYHVYTQQIRKEYSAVPGFIYRKGRKKVLDHFLEKDFIYSTKFFRDRFEIKARSNIKKELETL